MAIYEKPEIINTQKAIEQFKARIQGERIPKQGFILTHIEKNGDAYEAEYLGHFFPSEPTLQDIRLIATKQFNNEVKNSSEEFSPGSKYYSDSRRAAINGIIIDYYVVDINDGSFTSCMLMLQEEKEQLIAAGAVDQRIHVYKSNGKFSKGIRVYTNRDSYKIRTTLPQIGKVDLKKCPFCGRIDLSFTSKEDYDDDLGLSFGRHFTLRCRCGVSLTCLDRYNARDFQMEYEDVARYTIDQWNTRNGE